MTRRSPLTAVLVTAAAVQVLVVLGLPLVGMRTFTATDLLALHAPWRAHTAAGTTVWNPLFTDTVDAVLPAREVFAARARDGDFATWDPYTAGGTALGSVPDVGLLSPLALPSLVLPSWYAPAAAKLLEWIVAAGATALFLRRRGLRREAAVAAGLAYAVTAFQVVWTNWPHTMVGAFLPALFWAVERLLQRRDAGSTALLAVVVACLLLGGFPAVTVYAVVAAGVYALVRLRRVGGGWRPLVVLAAGGTLGAGLVAFQVLPFLARLSTLDLSYREQAGAHIPPGHLLTLALPDAYGSPAAPDGYFGWGNYAETNSFVGATVVVLALVALTWRPPDADGRATALRGLRAYLAGLAAFVIALTYADTPLLRGVQALPLIGTNFIGRTRPLLAFALTALAGVGLDALLAGARAPRSPLARWGGRAVWALAGLALLAGLAVLRRQALAIDRPWDSDGVLVGLVALALAGAVVIVAFRWPATGRTAAILLVVVLGAEALAFTAPYLPRPDRSAYYPATAAHDLLTARLGAQRVASAGTALYPGTSTAYRHRSVGGHTFYQPTWSDLLSTADRDTFIKRPGVSELGAGRHVATSPVLDRLAARFWAVTPEHVPYGVLDEVVALEPDAPPVVLGDGQAHGFVLPPGPVRGVVVTLAEEAELADPTATLTVRLRDGDGRLVAEASRRLRAPLRRGPLSVPVAAEAVPAGPLRAELALTGRDQRLPLASDGAGTPALRRVVPADDGLRLVHAGGVQLYERERALPRVRWASRAVVVGDRRARLDLLRGGVADDTVVLEADGPEATGASGTVTVGEDSGDAVRTRVDAAGPGYLVVADAVQAGWRAELDGTPVPLHRADHAFVAVAVPEGTHTVALVHDPAGWSLGLVVTAISAVVLAAIVVVAGTGRRRRRRTPTV